MTDLRFTKAGLIYLNRVILWAFIKSGYSMGMPCDKIAKKLGVKKQYVYTAASRLGFSPGVTNAYCAMTPEGVARGRRKREQHMRNKTVPITLPGPDWTKQA